MLTKQDFFAIPRTSSLVKLALLLLTGACSSSNEKASPMPDYDPCASTLAKPVSCDQAAQVVNSNKGHPVLVVIYGTGCSLSQKFMPEFLKLRSKYEAKGLTSLAFSSDECAHNLDAYFSEAPPFEPYWLIPWIPGKLTTAMGSIGIKIGADGFLQPLVAVIGADGMSRQQWEGTSSYDVPSLEKVIEIELGKQGI